MNTKKQKMNVTLYIKKHVLSNHQLQVVIKNKLYPLELKNQYWTTTIENHKNKYYYYVETISNEIIRSEPFPHLFPSLKILTFLLK